MIFNIQYVGNEKKLISCLKKVLKKYYNSTCVMVNTFRNTHDKQFITCFEVLKDHEFISHMVKSVDIESLSNKGVSKIQLEDIVFTDISAFGHKGYELKFKHYLGA